MEERKCNYERYRGLVQNDFANSEYHKLHNCFSVNKMSNFIQLSEAVSDLHNASHQLLSLVKPRFTHPKCCTYV